MRKTLGILMLIASASSFSYDCKEHPFYSSTQKNGKTIGLFASNEDFENTPEWEITEGEPPLSISSATNIVKHWSKTFYPRFDTVEISGLSLQDGICAAKKNHWVYVFHLSPVIDGNQLHGSGYMVAVTMSGKIIEPREYNKKP